MNLRLRVSPSASPPSQSLLARLQDLPEPPTTAIAVSMYSTWHRMGGGLHTYIVVEGQEDSPGLQGGGCGEEQGALPATLLLLLHHHGVPAVAEAGQEPEQQQQQTERSHLGYWTDILGTRKISWVLGRYLGTGQIRQQSGSQHLSGVVYRVRHGV